MEISYNIKSSPKKLFAKTTKKNNYVNSHYRNTIMSTKPNAYITCLTEDNDLKIPNIEEKLDKNLKKIMVNNLKF